MSSTIVELEPESIYADRTVFGELTLCFRHVITVQPDGHTEVTHQLTIGGKDADKIGPQLGPQISTDFPIAMTELLTAAERSQD